MNLIVCTCDNLGLAFNGRRQSRDENVIKDIINSFPLPIYMSAYSAPLFSQFNDKIVVTETPLDCPQDGYYFIERSAKSNVLQKTDVLVIYKWNRKYPFDEKLDLDLSCKKPVVAVEFAGTSHEKITKEIYRL